MPHLPLLLEFSRTNVLKSIFVSCVLYKGGRWAEPNKCSAIGEQKKEPLGSYISHY